MKKMAAALAAFLLCAGILWAAGEKKGKIEMEIKGFRNNKGVARIALFSGEKGFPQDFKKAKKTLTLKIKDKAAKGEFKDISYGEYAISVLHDENKDGKMNKNLFGVPKEGYGTSKDARGSWGPPKYKDAKFKLEKDELKLKIKMTY
jgi:uncharacterized protein (DUF2141 family)